MIAQETKTFTCQHCGSEKPVYWQFFAHGTSICLWCAEGMGLVKPRFMKGF